MKRIHISYSVATIALLLTSSVGFAKKAKPAPEQTTSSQPDDAPMDEAPMDEALSGEMQLTNKTSGKRTFGAIFDNFSVRLGMESAGPILFHDTKDQKLERTSVFQYGGRFAVVVGDEHRDAHRLGLGVAYNFVAKSESRNLNFVDPYLIYETGHRFVMQLHAGASIPTGSKALADAHGGLYNAIALRYSFDQEDDPSAIRVSPGLIAKSYVVTKNMSSSSYFIGAQLEFSFNTNK